MFRAGLYKSARRKLQVPVFTAPAVLPGLVRTLEIPREISDRQVALRPSADAEISVLAEISDRQQISDHTWKYKVVPKTRARVLSTAVSGEMVVVQPEIAVIGNSAAREAVLAAAEELATVNEAFGAKWRAVKTKYKTGLEDTSLVLDLVPSLLEAEAVVMEKLLRQPIAARAALVQEILSREIEQGRIRKSAENSVISVQRKFFLREVIRTLEKELGTQEGPNASESAITPGAALPAHVQKIYEQEKARLASIENPQEASLSRLYLNSLLAVPWARAEPAVARPDLSEISDKLDATHGAFTDAKQRVLELATCVHMRPLLLVGPPGTGKTSFAHAVGEALGRGESEIFSLGGLSDAAELRGHRRTYVGARPGKVASVQIRRGRSDLVVVLDEIDKIGNFSGASDAAGGTPSMTGVLLELLDERRRFHDNFLECELGTSEIFFIATANDLHAIPRPLLSRLEIVHVAGYVEEEKSEIARKFLIPRAAALCGIHTAQVAFVENYVPEIIRKYTKEMGVRELNTQIVKIIQKIKLNKLDKNNFRLADLLGPPRPALAENSGLGLGQTLALGWTEEGGEVLVVECMVSDSGSSSRKPEISVSGNCGPLLQEAVHVAVQAVSAKLGKFPIVHVHLPDLGVRKDGGSVGLAAAISVYSQISGQPVSRRLACTGEVTLTGRIVGVQGIREKVVASKANGVSEILLPAANEADWLNLPVALTRGMRAKFVETLDEAVAAVFH